ncbi:LOW QUALITY PROTEIN: uncharacterized protein LOC105255169, partial [Camponotus floridanus]|uniref:LOW QUALITY PROTEIN: uncharacterized protein LOC105255169 n=1 Tax=Camponotus floridanus TaxID=104421 RepID=UPI000DC67553
MNSITLPKNISLADPIFQEPGSIDLLIGAELYWKILLGASRNRINGQPALQNTKLGWIVRGSPNDDEANSSSSCLHVSDQILSEQVERFWKQETIPEACQYTKEDIECETKFIETTRRDETGRFIVRLPVRMSVKLGNSKDSAYRRFIALERRLSKDPTLRASYVDFMQDYEQQGHMSAVTNGNALESESLSATSSYVAAMFRQIRVDKRDRVLQRMHWREDSSQPVQVFELNTLTYGTACAPYLAMRCLQQLAREHLVDLPEAAHTIKEDCYMDDILTGSRRLDDAIKLQKNISQILMNGQFPLPQVFDPLGLLAPLLINGKIILQQLWSPSIEWDESVPENIRATWESYYLSLPKINELRIPRNVIPRRNSEKFNVVGFGDASEKAYRALSPLKTISLPRLELEAALLLSRLYVIARNSYGSRIDEVTLWSDSTIVLGWIKSPPCSLKTFVANRVSKIQDMTENIAWHHVSSKKNPADLITRGVSVDTLLNSGLWWNGPHWLKSDSYRPEQEEEAEMNLPEMKSTTMTMKTTEDYVLMRYSSFDKLKRVIAYCMLFKNNALNKKKIGGPLTVEECDEAEKAIVKLVQQETFRQEIRDLKEQREISRKSQIRGLDSFLDTDGLIRVGGRFRNSNLPWTQKHQIILPAKHFVIGLIIRSEHVRHYHCSSEQLLNVVRNRYWPVCGRQEVRKLVKGCLTCFQFRPTVQDAKMGNLPKQRVSGFIRSFTHTGIDYAGPLQVRESRRRGRIHVSKGYIAVFTCLSTKVVHLELVSDLTTEAFLAAMSRFTARRGICSQIFSDNGTNFVGASHELKKIYRFLEKEAREIETNLAQQRIVWNFFPPRAPHFGGIWEAAVKITKRHFYTVTQSRLMTFEEYATLLTEIEAILNSRSLTPLSNDPNDFDALTPAHFLIGGSLSQPVENNYLGTPDNRLPHEYLQELQRRNKWTTCSKNIELNALVLLKDDNENNEEQESDEFPLNLNSQEDLSNSGDQEIDDEPSNDSTIEKMPFIAPETKQKKRKLHDKKDDAKLEEAFKILKESAARKEIPPDDSDMGKYDYPNPTFNYENVPASNYRSTHFYDNEILTFSPLPKFLLLYVSVFTIFMAGLIANFEIDLKKIIALSTLSQLGLIIITLRLGMKFLSFYHLLTHAVFKSLLFICAGIIIHFIDNNQDIRFYGKLMNLFPFTIIRFYISRLALIGFPFLAEFYSKDLIMEIIYIIKLNLFILSFIILSIMFTVSYSLRLIYYVFFREFKWIRLYNIRENMLINVSSYFL